MRGAASHSHNIEAAAQKQRRHLVSPSSSGALRSLRRPAPPRLRPSFGKADAPRAFHRKPRDLSPASAALCSCSAPWRVQPSLTTIIIAKAKLYSILYTCIRCCICLSICVLFFLNAWTTLHSNALCPALPPAFRTPRRRAWNWIPPWEGSASADSNCFALARN